MTPKLLIYARVMELCKEAGVDYLIATRAAELAVFKYEKNVFDKKVIDLIEDTVKAAKRASI
jgi:hypothetical protein